MKKLRMVIEFETEINSDPRYLLVDALHDFVTVRERGNAAAYVDKRYPNHSEGRKIKKIAEVESRFQLAKDMHNAVLAAIPTEIKEDAQRCPHEMFYSGAGACPSCGS